MDGCDHPPPLHGVRVIEFAGIGPAPYAGMMLADMGAEVILIERPAALRALGSGGFLHRGKRSVCLDLKAPGAVDAVARLIERADVLIEGYRPGVMERLGLGPERFAQRHPRLVYGRVTGWGQTGPLAPTAGHDINYVALSGAASIASRAGQPPTVPASFLGDLSGGAMFLLFGVLCALREAERSGRGQVIDAAMVDGLVSLGSLVRSLRSQGEFADAPHENFFLHQSPFYDTFACADGLPLSLGAIEPPFYAELLQRLGLSDVDPAAQHDNAQWPALRERVSARLRERPRAEWLQVFEGSAACVAPVLTLDEAPSHPHHRARGTHVAVDGVVQSAVAPRLSRTPGHAPRPVRAAGADTAAVLESLGLSAEQIRAIRAA